MDLIQTCQSQVTRIDRASENAFEEPLGTEEIVQSGVKLNVYDIHQPFVSA